MKVLAIDQATSCGWYLDKDNHGVWDLSVKSNESQGIKLIRFRAHLADLYEKHDIDVIVYERVAGRFANALIHASKFIAVIELFCEDNNIEYMSYPATVIKKFATGKGNCDKPAMIQACIDKYGFVPETDDEADAAHLWHLTVHDLKIKQ